MVGTTTIKTGCRHALGDIMMILVFGSNGQVGLELAKFDGVLTLDCAEADLTNPEA